jgi:hypothetical protein
VVEAGGVGGCTGILLKKLLEEVSISLDLHGLDLHGGRVPEPDGAVARPRRHQLAVRRERHGRDRVRVAAERAALRPRGRVPEPDGAVARPRRHQLAVRRERHGPDRVRVAAERAALRPRGRVPEPDGAVARPRRHQLAVRRERHGPDRGRVAAERV